MIADAEESRITACFLLTNISSVSSYRSELEGIYRSLRHIEYLGLTPREVQHWCDNKGAVDNSNKGLNTPSEMICAEADLILAIHHLRSSLETRMRITCRHIYGHQDTRARDIPVILDSAHAPSISNPDSDGEYTAMLEKWGDVAPERTTPTGSRPLSVIANIEADRLASETASAARAEHLTNPTPMVQPPFPGSRALLKLKDVWITSKQEAHIHTAHWEAALELYCRTKYGWATATFHDIDWHSIGLARGRCTATQLMQTSKIMHDWLPVMHMYGHVMGLQQCPACTHTDETLDHLFHCTHPKLKRVRSASLKKTLEKGRELKIPRLVMEAFCGLLRAYFDGTEYTPQLGNRHIRDAANAQKDIGLRFLPRGFLTTKWRTALEALHCDHATTKLSKLVLFIWTDVTNAIWTERNDIVHHGNNLNRQADESRVDRRLTWYKMNCQEVLARTDFRLTSFDLESLHTMPLPIKRERLRQLDIAKAAHELECKLQVKGQQMITRFFISSKLKEDGVLHDENATES